ncbi:kinase-like protein, partial [Trichoderma citrinoviride]
IMAQATDELTRTQTIYNDSQELILQLGPRDTTIASKRSETLSAFELGELSKALVEESRSTPEARLVVAYPPAISLILDEDSAVTPLQPILGDYRPFVVTQVPEKPAFKFRLPYRAIPPDTLLDRLNCRIMYSPINNNCTLIHELSLVKGSQIFLTNTDNPPARISVARDQPCILSQGFWRASATIGGGDDALEYDLAYIQVLQRQFTVPISQDPDMPVRKRRAPEVTEDPERSVKRQKTKASLQIDITLAPESSQLAPGVNDNNRALALPPRRIISRAPTSVLDLKDGYMASIPGTVKGGLEPYELRQRYRFMTNQNASIAISTHSGIKADVAAKALFPDSHGYDLWHIGRLWMRETTLLQYTDHVSRRLFLLKITSTHLLCKEHIVKLKGFDARVYAIYYEFLPPSLARGKWSSLQPDDAEIILVHISSALAYLAAWNFVHNDIQPANIAYSGHRAVLFNFRLASPSGSIVEGRSPWSLWYLPPEFNKERVCSLAADVWALGITMLYLLGKMSLPDEEEVPDARKGWKLGNDAELRSRMRCIRDCKARLNKGDAIESLVFRMLDADAASRIKAADIEARVRKRNVKEEPKP